MSKKIITDILNIINELIFYIVDNDSLNELIVQEIKRAICYLIDVSKKEYCLSQKQYLMLNTMLSIINKIVMKSATSNINNLINELKIYNEKLVFDIMESKKIDIVFLPYKASMWDSFETVWEAAYRDIRCNPMVMPIPYCDKKKDLTASKWYYEGNEIPCNIPIISWKEYDLKTNNPDVIFIHNPYDAYNKITSVDTRFYSNYLKMYTDMLVYIPYYVSGDYDDKEMCEFPGLKNADKIVVQNESVRKCYLDKFSPDKVIALGSPKIEKALKSKRFDFDLPDEWMDKIKEKKVILYNTHLSSIFIDPKMAISKYNHVFDIVSNYSDAVLWWRPHPLLISAIKSTCPELLDDYIFTVKRFKQENIGIYDDTPDMHRALCWSDVYYGDDISSLLYLSNEVGKTCVVQYYNQLICDNRYGGNVDIPEFYNNPIIREKKGEDKLEEILQNKLIINKSKIIKQSNAGEKILDMIINSYFNKSAKLNC